jgi:hypothetical protein
MKPTATLTPDGQAYDLNATAILLISADTAYGEGMRDTPPTGQARAATIVRDLLAAATAGGYAQADILESLLARGESSKRVTAMCADAMNAAGDRRIGQVLASMRAQLKGGVQ